MVIYGETFKEDYQNKTNKTKLIKLNVNQIYKTRFYGGTLIKVMGRIKGNGCSAHHEAEKAQG